MYTLWCSHRKRTGMIPLFLLRYRYLWSNHDHNISKLPKPGPPSYFPQYRSSFIPIRTWVPVSSLQNSGCSEAGFLQSAMISVVYPHCPWPHFSEATLSFHSIAVLRVWVELAEQVECTSWVDAACSGTAQVWDHTLQRCNSIKLKKEHLAASYIDFNYKT